MSSCMIVSRVNWQKNGRTPPSPASVTIQTTPDTWEKPIVHMPASQHLPMSELAPRAWAAACELLGGEDRVRPCAWGDSFIVNFSLGADRAWQPPSADAPGWHVDGDFFRHFLDSPEQGLLTIVFWSDVAHEGGGTFAAPDSVGPIARFLASRPKGLEPNGFDFPARIGECRTFAELTGRAGDVVLIHPFMLHASSQNVLGVPRFITNPCISLREPMQFDRPAGDYSPVERAILNGLGVDKLAFAPTAPRQNIVPERVKRQQEQR